jgi:hypothetical protein
MLREIAILLVISLASIGCILLFLPLTMYVILGGDVFYLLDSILSLLAFVCLIYFSGDYIRRFYHRSPKYATVFLIVLLAVIIISSTIIYWWALPFVGPHYV